MRKKKNKVPKVKLGTLYLMQSGNYLKIGYTKNFASRMSSYRTHNPDIKVLDTREGTYSDESYLHKKLKRYAIDEYSEWMIYNEEIIKTFKTATLKHLPPLRGEKRDKIVEKIIKQRIYQRWVNSYS